MPPKAVPKSAPKAKAVKKKKEQKIIIPISASLADPTRLLYWAVVDGRPAPELRELVFRGADVNAPYALDRWTPLLRACSLGRADMVSELLRLRADVNHRDAPKRVDEDKAGKKADPKAKAKPGPAGARPASAAPRSASAGGGKGNQPVKCDRNRAIPVPMEPVADGGSALHVAVSSGSIATLNAVILVPGMDPNLVDKKGRTALLLAASEGRPTAVRLLLAAPKVNAFAKDREGRNCLHVAAGRGHRDVVLALLRDEQRGSLLEEKDAACRTVLDHAMNAPPPLGPEVVQLLRERTRAALPKEDEWLQYALRTACPRLLPGGRVVREEAVDELGETSLFRLCRQIAAIVDVTVQRRRVQLAEKMLEDLPPSALEKTNKDGQTPLHVACGAAKPLVEKKKASVVKDEVSSHGAVGTDRSKFEEMKAMIAMTGGDSDEDNGPNPENDQPKLKILRSLQHEDTELVTGQRILRELVSALLRHGPVDLAGREDKHGCTAKDYALEAPEVDALLVGLLGGTKQEVSDARAKRAAARSGASGRPPDAGSAEGAGDVGAHAAGAGGAAPGGASGRPRSARPSSAVRLAPSASVVSFDEGSAPPSAPSTRPASAISTRVGSQAGEASAGPTRPTTPLSPRRAAPSEVSTAPSTRPATPLRIPKKG